MFSTSLKQLVDKLGQAVRAQLSAGLSADLLEIVRFDACILQLFLFMH